MKMPLKPDYQHFNIMCRIKLSMIRHVPRAQQSNLKKDVIAWYHGKVKDLKEICNRFYVEM